MPKDSRDICLDAIYNLDNQTFRVMVSRHSSVMSIIRHLGLSNYEAPARIALKDRAIGLGIKLPKGNGNKVHINFSDSEIFVINPPVRYATVRARARAARLPMSTSCWICGQGRIWAGKELKMELYHFNGNKKDCRRSNLKFVCPNCLSQES